MWQSLHLIIAKALFIFLFSVSNLSAQLTSISEIEFFDENGNKIINAYAGGLRAPQFNKIDLNFDGSDDLLVFDRAGDVMTAFISGVNTVQSYKFESGLLNNFPKIQEWMIIEDFNKDGIKDIFCFPTNVAVPGIEVWKGKNIEGVYDFDLVEFPEDAFDIIYIPVSNGRTQAYVSVVDIPAIKDIDNDGDIDILSFDPTGSTVYYYQNQGIEKLGDSTALIFRLEDNCYGRFVESGFSQDVLLSADGEGCANSFLGGAIPTTRHAGSTIEAFDHNGDGLIDLLLGDIAYNGINLLVNEGVDRSWITSSIFGFPTNEPIEMELFLTPKSIDVDNDNVNEFIVAPNDPITSQTIDNVWYFENIANSGFSGELVTKNFLRDGMIDLGEYNLPVFTDYNQDGLIDLVVGTSGEFINTSSKNPSLILYKNIGGPSAPIYQLTDNDYLKFKEFENTSSFFAPTFGDLDGDGDMDLLVGDDRGQLYYGENTSGAGQPFSFDSFIYQFQGIQVSSFARPHIVDLNDDGLGDIVLGERNFNSTSEFPIASFNYFENIGSVGNPQFEKNVNIAPNSPALGGINLKEQGFINNNSALSIWPNGDEVVLVTGSEVGNVRLFNFNKDNYRGIYEEIMDNEISSIDEGMKSSPSLADIDADNLLELVVGNYRGGLTIYETDIVNNQTISVNESEQKLDFTLFPNPVFDALHLEFSGQRTSGIKVEIYNDLGINLFSLSDDIIGVQDLSPGIYFIKVTSNKFTGIRQFIKI